MTRTWMLLAFACLAVATRLPDLAHPTVAANEGLYACVAREVLHGHLPYLTAWEAKPPLFFAAIAAGMALAGGSIAGLRIVNVVAIFATMCALDVIGRRLGSGKPLWGVFPALLYAAVSCSDAGTSVEAEVLGSACIAGGFAFVAVALQTRGLFWARALCAGLCAGAALQMKVTLAVEVLWLLLVVVYAGGWRGAVACIGGMFAVVGACVGAYVATGTLAAYLDANVLTVLRRGGSPHVPFPSVVREQLEALFPLWLAAFFARRWIASLRDAPVFVLVLAIAGWLVAALLQLLPVGEFFAYQWFTLMAPLCLLASAALLPAFESHARRAAVVIVCVAMLAHVTGRVLHVRAHDSTASVAAYLNAQPHGSGAWLFVGAGDSALYVLTGAALPTRFPYGQHITQTDQQRASGSGGVTEMARVLGGSPSYIVYQASDDESSDAAKLLVGTLRRNYARVFSDGDTSVYRRR